MTILIGINVLMVTKLPSVEQQGAKKSCGDLAAFRTLTTTNFQTIVKKSLNSILGFGLAIALLSGCAKKEEVKPSETSKAEIPTGNVEFVVTPTIGGDPLRVGSTITLPSGEALTIRDFKFYLSDIGLAKPNSQEAPARPIVGDTCQAGVWLLDFGKANTEGIFSGVRNALSITTKVDTGSYVDTRLAIAVPRTYNSADIATNPIPLNARQGMYWTWNSGFKFLVINGTSPAIPQGATVHLSIGQNSRRMEFNFKAMLLAANREKIRVIAGKTTKIHLTFELNALFTNTDGTPYQLAPIPGKPSTFQVHGGYWSDQLKANAAQAFDMASFSTINN